MRLKDIVPDLNDSRTQFCVGTRKREDKIPRDALIISRVLERPESQCLKVWSEQSVEDILRGFEQNQFTDFYLSGGLPNPLSISTQFGLHHDPQLKVTPTSKMTIRNAKDHFESGKALPLAYSYWDAVSWSVGTSPAVFRASHGFGPSNFLDMTFDQARDVGPGKGTPILNWDLLSRLPDGKIEQMHRCPPVYFWHGPDGESKLSGYTAGSSSLIFYAGKPFGGEFSIACGIGARAHDSDADALLAIGVHNPEKLEEGFRVVYSESTKSKSNPEGLQASDLHVRSFATSVRDFVRHVDQRLAPYSNGIIEEVVVAGETAVHNSVVTELRPFLRSLGNDLFVRRKGEAWHPVAPAPYSRQ